MFLLGFLLAATGLILVLGFLVQFRSYRKPQRLVLVGLSVMFTAHLWIAHEVVFSQGLERWFQLYRLLLGMGLVITLGVLELTRRFLRGTDEADWMWGRWRVSLFTLCVIGVAAAETALAIPGLVVYVGNAGGPVIRFESVSLIIPTVQVLVSVYILYLLESTYRFAQDYQRRIGRLCFIGLGGLAGFHAAYYSYVLLYRNLPMHFSEASSVIYGVVYPVVLVGFLRYRLASESISIPRDTVYTSATVFLTGASFLGVAVTVLIFRWFDLDFSFFERFLVGFTLCFLALLVFGSGTMRRRVTRFVNQQMYSRKYDYQDQFFRLHKSMMSGADVDAALTELVENMKYSVTVDDAYFFILNWQDGNFYQHENKEEATSRGLVISGDSPLVRLLAEDGGPVDLKDETPEGRIRGGRAASEPLVGEQKFDAVFPIFIAEGGQGLRLVGILALQGGRERAFDSEDLELIAVFTNSIGNALFRNRVLTERIEQKQFESFHHVASFIIHDIKNQVATLSLLLKNAERNMSNPSFQASMLTAVKSCSDSLLKLIDRLAVAPRRQEAAPSGHPLRPLLDEVVSHSGLAPAAGSPEGATAVGVRLEFSGDDAVGRMDRQALFFVVRNLVTNALEAMKAPGQGMLRIGYGPLGPSVPPRLRELFGGGEQFFRSYGAYILVEDSGAGMAAEFVRRRLFQPFATTKEKGVGIGLYQCKTLVEKMGGRILCHSVLGRGTEFCILLLSGAASDTAYTGAKREERSSRSDQPEDHERLGGRV